MLIGSVKWWIMHGQVFKVLPGWISGVFMGAIQGLSDAFNNAGQTLQNAFTEQYNSYKIHYKDYMII